MYSIMVVDDEIIVREGIEQQIQWDELGFRFEGAYENGREAFVAIEQHRPDVILTDINMPLLDGLQLTEKIRMRFPQIKVIILTGYDEFEYAQKAVKLKVYDFILKPITANELKQLLIKMKMELDVESQTRVGLNKIQIQLNESLPLLKEETLERLLRGSLSEQAANEKLMSCNITLNGTHFKVMAFDLDHLEHDRSETDEELLRFASYNIIQECAHRYRQTVFRTKDKKIVVLLYGESADQLNKDAKAIAEAALCSIEQYLRITATVGIGDTRTKSELRNCYNSALSALEYRFLLGMNRMIFSEEVEQLRGERFYFTIDQEEQLKQTIKTGTHAEVEAWINSYLQKWRQSLPTYEQCELIVQRILVTIIQAAEELGLSQQELFGSQHPMENIKKFKTLDDIQGWLNQLCCDTMSAVSRAKHDINKQQIVKAEEYIKSNFDNEDLDLKSVLDAIHMSSSHFSALFKKHTGKTFIEYVTDLRIAKAKELLKFTSLRTYEIAEQVGYSKPQYYSLIFKKMTGDSPTEFRRKNSIEPSDV